MIAIDANIFIYSFDDAAPVKHVKATAFLAQLLKEDNSSVPVWQVACETLAWLRRRMSEGRFSADDVSTRFFTLLNAYPLTCPSGEVLELSFELQSRYSLSH